MIRLFMNVVAFVYNNVAKEKNDDALSHEIRLRKAEVVTAEGCQWWYKARRPNRETSVLTNGVQRDPRQR